jgi:ribosomal protein L37E
MTTPAPPKLPTVYFDEFPKETQDFLLQDIKRKEWLLCAYCGIQAERVRLKRCAACGNNIPGVRTYYCVS